MKVLSFKCSAFCLLLSLFSIHAQALEVTDDTGRSVHLEKNAQRILALSPHATELVFAAGAEDKLIGVVSYSNYPEAAKKLPSVGDAARLDRERILALEPDLVIAWDSGNQQKDLEWLNKISVPVYRSEPRRLEQIALNIEHIGMLAGTQEVAQKNSDHFRRRLESLRQQYSRASPISVFYQLWPRPLMTVNGDHIISEVLRLCGGHNLFAELPVLATQVSREAVILANPQAIAAGADPDANDPLADWLDWPTIKAVKNGHLYRVDADLIHRQTPRILDGIEQLCRMLTQVE